MTTLRSAVDILHDFRVLTPSSALGRYYAICPQCSHKRKKANQKLKCLGVTVDGQGVKFGCNHCGWRNSGVRNAPRAAANRNGCGRAANRSEARLQKSIFASVAATVVRCRRRLA